jgi:hypothetical protein
MKKYLALLIFVISVCISCSSDSEHIGSRGSEYFPTKVNNYWTYTLYKDNVLVGTDSLSVSKNQTESGYVYSYMKSQGKGFFAGLMDDNALGRFYKNCLSLSGSFNFKVTNSFSPHINLFNIRLIDEMAANDTELHSYQNTNIFFLNPSLNYVSADYKLTTRNVYNYDSYTTPNGQVYSDVKEVKLTLNIRLYDDYWLDNIPQTTTYLGSQDVIVSHLYFAKGIGLVYSHTVKDYHFESNPENDYPQDYHAVEEEYLEHYRANP